MSGDEQVAEVELATRLDDFGQAVRGERLRQGLTLPAAVERTRKVMSASMLGHIERGHRRPSLGQALLIADALDVPLASLLDEGTREVATLAEFVTDVVEAIDEVFAEHRVRGVLHPASPAEVAARLVSA